MVLMTIGFLSDYAAISAKTVNEIRQVSAFEPQPPAIIVSVLRSSVLYTHSSSILRGREKKKPYGQADSVDLSPNGCRRETRKRGYDELLMVL
jgi:hypothetical protein